ncbi:hypothetical protein D9758_004805 [Tetrapyrgos nigripes]|uniref:Uncharacterized protein n=1 Tax=Tetrapyrgos nigripes TaxID=182062 RepID=A0A8H5LIT3_9AGAR|nr:hypothetical protein D9758_004805 [Tetrapyrgos nigripes]
MDSQFKASYTYRIIISLSGRQPNGCSEEPEDLMTSSLRPHSYNAKRALQRNSDADKEAVITFELGQLRLQACPLERYPLKQTITPGSSTLICPQSLEAKAFPAQKIPFREGQHLFSLTYYHYSKAFSPSEELPSKNYVSTDGIAPRRYEYLGPQPCIAGFLMDPSDGVTQILWWDSFLHMAWSNNETWAVDAQFDETVQSWLPIIQKDMK